MVGFLEIMPLFAVGIAFLASGPVMAQETRPTTKTQEFQPLALSVEQNMERLLQIRLAFQKHPALGPLNLGIQYRDGVVTLWGPVENPAVIPTARAVAMSQKGVTEVRSELYTGKTGDRPTGPVSSLVPPELPVRVQAASPNPHTGQLPAHTPRDENPQPRRLEPVSDSPNLSHRGTPTGVPSIARAGQVLRFPKTEEPRVAATTGLGTTGMGANPVEPVKAPGLKVDFPLSDKLVEVRTGNPRFQGITWSLRGGNLEIQYPGSENGPAIDFARVAQTLPGVTSVIVKPRTPFR